MTVIKKRIKGKDNMRFNIFILAALNARCYTNLSLIGSRLLVETDSKKRIALIKLLNKVNEIRNHIQSTIKLQNEGTTIS